MTMETEEIQPGSLWLEPAIAILMAVSSLATAWCSYQNSRWSEESADHSTEADKLERLAATLHLEAGQVEAMHSRMWMEAMDAEIDGDEKLARFYKQRFADELRPAYEKWVATNPLENPHAPPHPFSAGFYQQRFVREVSEAKEDAAAAEKLSNDTGHTASRYLSSTVLLATVLFFAGTAERFDQRRVRMGSLVFAGVLFVYAIARVSGLPIA